jgi:hypothetical protein
MNSGKRNIVIGILIVIIVAAVIVAWNLWSGTGPGNGTVAPKPSASPAANSPKAPQTADDVKALVRQALDSRDASLCEKIESATERKSCEMNMTITKANDAKDPKLCEQIDDAIFRTACADNIVIVRARDAKDPSLCELMTDKTRVPECKVTAKQ